MLRAPVRTLYCVLLVLMCARVASAAAPPPTQRIAVVLIAKNAKDAASYDAFAQALYNLGDRAPELTLLNERALAKLLKGDPKKMFTRCGPALGCIAKLGKRAKAQQVLLGKWTLTEGNAAPTLQYVLIATQTNRIQQKGVLSIPKPADAPKVVAANFKSMFGVAPPAAAEAAAVPAAATPSPSIAAQAPPVLPEAGGPAIAESTPPAAASPVPAAPVAAAPVTEAPVSVTTLDKAPTPYLFITSLTLLGVGAVGLATGAALVLDAHHQADAVSATTAPAEALSTVNSANSKIRLGNTLFGVGGGIAAVGAVLLVLDRFELIGGHSTDGHVALFGDISHPGFGWVWNHDF